MKARAKLPHRTIRAFTGREFVSYEWRPVPPGHDDEAARLEAGGYLILLSDDPPAVAPEPDATPAAAELAADHGLDLATVEGSGSGGRILKGDVIRILFEEEE